jgi:trehalose 2-sulfotransferase
MNRAYVVCTTPRSGSWLLCEGMSAAGAGYPREYFGDDFCEAALKGPDQFEAEWSNILRHGTSGEVFGAKIHWSQFERLAVTRSRFGGITRSASEALERFLPGLEYIWLRRRDKVRQAISYYRASATGEWWRLNEAPRPRPLVLAFDRPLPSHVHSAIHKFEQHLRHHDDAWAAYFSMRHIQPKVIIDYEELYNDYSSTILRVLTALLGMEARSSHDIAPLRLLRQADEITDDWVRRYRAAEQVAPALLLSLQARKKRKRKNTRRISSFHGKGYSPDRDPLLAWNATELTRWRRQYGLGFSIQFAHWCVLSLVAGSAPKLSMPQQARNRLNGPASLRQPTDSTGQCVTVTRKPALGSCHYNGTLNS